MTERNVIHDPSSALMGAIDTRLRALTVRHSHDRRRSPSWSENGGQLHNVHRDRAYLEPSRLATLHQYCEDDDIVFIAWHRTVERENETGWEETVFLRYLAASAFSRLDDRARDRQTAADYRQSVSTPLPSVAP